MSNLLQLLENINANTSFRAKTINLDAVLLSLSELEQLLKLKEPPSNYISDEQRVIDAKFIKIVDGKYCFNYNIFSYIDNYDHLTTDKKERAELKKISLKISDKYNNFFKKYNRTH